MSAPAEAPSVRRVVYFADPMCSWCWGFAPVVAQMRAACGDRIEIRLVTGGLRAGETTPMDERSRAYVRHHWEEVAAQTGQPFDFDFFAREDFVYDTEPACRAAVAMRCLLPGATLDHLHALQHAFYDKNRDVTREDVLADVAAAFVPREHFLAVWRAPEIIEATRADFALTQRLGIGGFPTVLLQDGNSAEPLTAGWQPFDALEPLLTAWLTGRRGQ